MTRVTAALPRSLLHLQFLIDNDARADHVLFRDDAMALPIERAFPGRGVSLGRELLPGKSLSGLLAARRHNRGYYAQVGATIDRLGIERLILFLEGEPLERYLTGLQTIRELELWEDGLSHYVDLTSDAWYAARGLVQAAAGFHPTRITRRRMDRSRALVRDRFSRKNLVLAPPAPAAIRRNAILLIGSPLVEDRIIAASRLRSALRFIGDALNGTEAGGAVYLPHPREDAGRLADDLASVGDIELAENPDGLIAHLGRTAYRGHVAAISTGLLDIGRFDRSAFAPGLFGLSRMSRVLRRWADNPLPVLDEEAALRSWISALPR